MKGMILVAGATVMACAAAAHAEVLYSNFGDNDTYDVEYAWTLTYGGPLAGDAYQDAVAFTVTGGDYYFNSADLAITHYYGPDLAYVSLHADDNGAPGTVLETTTARGTNEWNEFIQSSPTTATFSGTIVLEEGKQYWLSVRTETTDAWLGWAYNITDDFGLRAWKLNDGDWNPVYGIPGTDSERGVFRINGTLVPAPAALALLGIAGVTRRRRR